ncbi:MAG: hypothetical protein JO307_18030 [Bryobacterales bacterium]|nr:hypothetical protein [Bryobacterales bacterium]
MSRLLRRSVVWLGKAGNLLYATLLLSQLAYIWSFTYFPSTDGPAHLATARMLLDYIRSPGLREHYILVTGPYPNWTADFLLTACMSIFPASVPEKLTLTAYFVLMAVCARIAIYLVAPRATFLAFLILPLSDNYLVHSGFYSFVYGVPLFLISFAYWLKHRAHLSRRSIAALTLLHLALWFTHLVPLVLLFIAVAIVRLYDLLALCRGDVIKWDLEATVVRRNSFGLIITFAPTLLLFTDYLHPELNLVIRLFGGPDLSRVWTLFWGTLAAALVSGSFLLLIRPAVRILTLWPARVQGGKWLVGTLLASLACAIDILHTGLGVFVRRLRLVAQLPVLASYYNDELLASKAFALMLAGMIAYLVLTRKVQKKYMDLKSSLFAVLTGYVFAVVSAPNAMVGGSRLIPRLAIFPVLILMPWFALFNWSTLARWTVQACATAITVYFLALHIAGASEANGLIAEYVSGQHLVKGQDTFITISRPDFQTQLRIDVLSHAGGYIAGQNGAVLLNNYQFGTRVFPFAGVRGYRNSPDYILTWADPQPVLGGSGDSMTYEGVHYNRIFSSRPRGYMKVFQRMD